MQRSIKSFTLGAIMVIISLIFLSQALIMEKASITDPAGGSFFPLLISIIMLICGIVTIFQNDSTDNKELEKFTKKEYQFILIYFIMIVVYVVLLSLISFFPATFIFLVGSMIYLRNVSWVVNITTSIGSIIVIYLLFSQLFHIIFP